MYLFETRQLQVSIGTTRVCETLDFRINAGDRWCILGRNGTGKTTLLRTFAGLRSPTTGEIRLNNRSLHQLPRRTIAQHIGLLFQDHNDPFPASVLDTVLSSRHPWIAPLQWESEQDYSIARQALQAVELEDMEQRLVTTLSGGERRRLGIACLLAQEPQLQFLDEPSNHLDIHHQIRMLELLRRQAEDYNRAQLMVMHDLNLATRFCNRFLLLFGDGETAQGNAAEILTRAQLGRLYRHPLQAIPGPHGMIWLPQ
jgi:iron complex transport system ATP-binding protein